ncbi:MAG: hypothetical protein A4E62_00919 [Syntrophorhabdus sp. PtaU1.Bin002]|nr:MAG: hypothetical protein A4E58_00095 [Syntrophorhabdus sp. PtaB.Bin006]OPY72314.1 MAG: hypothetical protein A4E62_00919 [Syntrophorhabdus sp. PtaU1.Bin002]
MTRKVGSLFQQGDNVWCGLTLEIQGRRVVKCDVIPGKDFGDLNNVMGNYPRAVSLGPHSGYLVHLRFPFSGKRKISTVVRGELEEYFPFSLDDIRFDFQEMGRGNVLVAAVQKPYVDKFRAEKQTKLVTINTIAILYALQWFNVVSDTNFVFAHIDTDRAIIIAFREGRLWSIRQLVYSSQADILREALHESTSDKELSPKACYIVCSQEDPIIVAAVSGLGPGVRIETPFLRDYLGLDLPASFWAGVGAALLALNAKDEINLLGNRYQGFPRIEKLVLYGAGSIAAVSLVLAGMSYLNLHLKNRTYKYLGVEQNNLYRSVFPKSPPVKNVSGVFEEKIKAMSRDVSGGRPDTAKSPLRLLTDLSSRIDTQVDVKLSEFRIDGNDLTVAGITTSFASAEKIKKAIEQVSGVKSVEIQNIDLSGGQVKFRMEGKL